MNKFDKIKYIMDLEDRKSKLQRQISKISNEISEQKKSCSHISVDLGYYGLYPSTGDEYCCLLCGMGKNREYYYEPKYMVHAENYLTQYDIKDDSHCIEKLEHIQILALGILRDNPDMSDEELVSKLNDLIENSIAKSQQAEENNGPKLIKKPNSKKIK